MMETDVTESPTPMGLPAWRAPDFDRVVNQTHGVLTIMGQAIEPADALATDRRAYEEALAGWRNEERVALDNRIVNEFPFPIANCYRRFLKGTVDPLRKLYALRDTAEAAVHLLFALTLGELRSIDGQVVGTHAKPAWVHSDKLHERIELVRTLIQWGGSELALSASIPMPALGGLDKLRHARNDISHRAELTKSQALEVLSEAEPLLIRCLACLDWLADVQLIQPLDHEQFLVFTGASAEQEVAKIQLSQELRRKIADRECANREVFLLRDGHLFSLFPIIVPQEDAV